MDERAASSHASPDDLTATSYVPQLLGGHLTYSARDLAEATDTPIERVLQFWIALGFQAFLIIVCVAIYAVLVQSIATESDIIMAIWSCVGYTVLLCFTLFKTGSLAKSVFNAH